MKNRKPKREELEQELKHYKFLSYLYYFGLLILGIGVYVLVNLSKIK